MRNMTIIVAIWFATFGLMAFALPTPETDLAYVNGTEAAVAFQAFGATTSDNSFPVELLGLDPSFVPSKPANLPSDSTGPTELTDVVSLDNVKQDNPYWEVKCDPKGYGQAEMGAIRSGIKHLRKQTGDTALEPNHCTRLYCKHHSAIYWCNTATGRQEITLKSMGDAANIVFKKCDWHFGKGPTSLAGVLYHVDRFNVVVKGDSWKC
ncbi:hypothetical protein BJX65DRAFT_1633 [Aspergillus insuetus]